MKNEKILEIIKKLAEKRAPSGIEKARGEVFKQEMDMIIGNKDISIKEDALCNFYVKFDGQNAKKSIGIYAHIDEIGGTIRKINKSGCLEFSMRGGYETRWLISRKVQILNKERKWINGVIEGRSTHSTPPALRNSEKLEIHEQKIYIGAKNKEEVIKLYSIHVGAPFVFFGTFGLLNPSINDDIIAGYSLDNLVAVTSLFVLTEKIVNNLLDESGVLNKNYNLYIVATSREEIGTEGALFFSRNNAIDQVIAMDIGLVADFSGSVNSGITLTGGPVIIWQEQHGAGVFDYDLCREFARVADENEIPYQNGVCEYYGSDAGKAQKWLGIPSVLIGIPVMYSHNVPEIGTLSGIQEGAELVYRYLKNHD